MRVTSRIRFTVSQVRLEDSPPPLDAGEVDAVVIVPANRARREAAAVMTARAFAGIALHQPKQGFLVAAGQAIGGDHQHRAAGSIGLLDQRLRDIKAGRGVELEPDRRAADLGDLVDREVRGGRQHLEMIAGARGPGDRDLAVLVEEPVAAGRRDENR
jgi:hypothetical protein